MRGRELNKRLGLGAAHALYRECGDWYHALVRFPGVLFDRNGYLLFQSKSEYELCGYLKRGPGDNQVHVENGIASVPGYVRLSSSSTKVD
jgi:5-methylcytosine-specific restriction enzyme A